MFLGEMEESVPDVDLARCYSFNLTENSSAKKPHPLKKPRPQALIAVLPPA
jgi:hypothetical protein